MHQFITRVELARFVGLIDVTMLVGNGYVPGHAELALDLIRRTPGLRALFERRIRHEGAEGGQP